MESGFGVGRYRGDVVATWVQGSRVFRRRPRRRSAPKLVLANNEPVSGRVRKRVFVQGSLYTTRDKCRS